MSTQTEEAHLPSEVDAVNSRFVNALRQSMISNRLSQRELCAEIGITIGTLTKYLRGAISPTKVGLEIQEKLAATLGVSLTALSAYYKTGEYVSRITIDDVTSWIKKESVQADMPLIMAAASTSVAFDRAAVETVEVAIDQPLYTWPADQLLAKGIKRELREAVGLSDDVMEALSHGEYDEACVKSFAILVDESIEDIAAAFKERAALTN